MICRGDVSVSMSVCVSEFVSVSVSVFVSVFVCMRSAGGTCKQQQMQPPNCSILNELVSMPRVCVYITLTHTQTAVSQTNW